MIYLEYWRTNDQWYAHVRCANWRTVWTTGEGYASKRNVLRAIHRFVSFVGPSAEVVIRERKD